MIARNFHKEYAKCVRTFCDSLSPEIQVTTEEIDTYFRSCALYLWAHSSHPEDLFRGINQIYTDSQVKFTRQEFEDQINLYRTNLAETARVPDFFLRMLASDKDLGTDDSRWFTEVQNKILELCSDCIQPDLSSLDCRRREWMREQLVIICDQAEIGEESGQEEEISLYGGEDAELQAMLEEMIAADPELQALEKEIQEMVAEIRGRSQSDE